MTLGTMTGSLPHLAATWDDATTFHLTAGQAVYSPAPALIAASSKDLEVRTGGRAYRTCER
jgi:hypothetical protein